MQRIDSLTSLRFFAALIVFLHHLQFMTFSGGETSRKIFHYFFEGHAGVTFFFILSGFILSKAYEGRMDSTGARCDFMMNRIFRIYPVHLLMLPTCLAIFGGTTGQVIANLTLTQSMFPDMTMPFSVNPVAWSISNEMFFYVAFTLLVGMSTKHIAGVLTGILSLSLYLALVADYTIPSQQWMVYINPVGRLGDFMTGMLIARIATKAPAMTRGAASLLEVASVGVLAIFVVVATMPLTPILPTLKLDVYYLLPMALIVYVFSFGRGVLSTALSARWLVFLGEASFSFYMVHYLVINLIMVPTIVRYATIWDVAFYASMMLSLSIALSSVLYLYFERPVNLFLRDWWRRRSAVGPVSAIP